MTPLLLLLATAGAGTQPPADQFWTNLQQLCGKAYEGRVVEAPAGDTTFANKRLVMDVRSCTPTEIRIPFHVGEDRSRTWVLARTDSGIRLKHDHRHEDGSEDKITQYGGDSRAAGSATRLEFPADTHTASLIPEAKTNVWTVELEPDRTFVYALRREGTGRRFRIEFDLSKAVDAPPAPWGSEKPDFTGTWVVVSPERSAGQEETVKHDGMTLTRDHPSERGRGGHSFTYRLDGSESRNVLSPHPGEEVVVLARAAWEGETLVIREAATYPDGRKREVTARWRLDEQGQLHIDAAITGTGSPQATSSVVYRRKDR